MLEERRDGVGVALAARRVKCDSARFGTQIDTQPLTSATTTEPTEAESAGMGGLSPRRVAAYLSKYVTKSLHDFGITARRISPEAISDLDVTDHTRAILSTITELADCETAAGSLAEIG